MEGSFCAPAAALFSLTLLWKLKGDLSGSGYWTAASRALMGALMGATVCWTVPAALCGPVLLGCSFILIHIGRRDELLPTESRAVLVTGCDSGFGLALVQRLSERGLKVFAGVLDVNGSGARRLRERQSENLQVLQLDVTDGSQIEAARRHIITQVAAGTGLWGLVNNAGVLPCPLDAELHPMAAYRRCMDVNFLAAVRMCQVFLPLLRRSRGRIVNVSSMAGEVPMPLLAAYGASKAALSVLSKVMRLELSVWGVEVSVIQPAGFRTNIFGNSDDVTRYTDKVLATISSDAREDYGEAYIASLPNSLSKMSRQSAEDLSPVVDDMCHALLSAHPRPVYMPGQMGWLLPFLHRYCPTGVFDAIAMKLFKHTDCEPAGLNRS
ncbi:estradiol 17-beta-dehydrogenase 2 [Dicentrarchus labrax]|uniref:Hydroxysteroid (17-beta) dehydrogenase 2 n=1 Tax=Dicentrarchus labrax TaxID=13489 RepID=A0A8C4GW01_DICLA|nr:estradiol 17-beta-dehydrogenase 2 [Dicentrarchus labrax]